MKTQTMVLAAMGTIGSLVVVTVLAATSVEAGEVFNNPKMHGRLIDKCVNSNRFPGSSRCSGAAQRAIAKEFCRRKDHPGDQKHRVKNGRFLFGGPVVIMTEKTRGSRVLQRDFKRGHGRDTIDRIECGVPSQGQGGSAPKGKRSFKVAPR
jgi:hypothetical protein